MQKPVLHRHADGSAHYTHCCGEEAGRPYRFEWLQKRRFYVGPHHSRTGRAVTVSALGLAAAGFAATMLVSPPKSIATASPDPSSRCLQMEQAVRPWFDREVARRARMSVAADQADFNRMLLTYQSAHTLCMAGRVRDAENKLKRLEVTIAALAERYPPRDED